PPPSAMPKINGFANALKPNPAEPLAAVLAATPACAAFALAVTPTPTATGGRLAESLLQTPLTTCSLGPTVASPWISTRSSVVASLSGSVQRKGSDIVHLPRADGCFFVARLGLWRRDAGGWCIGVAHA